MYSAMISSVIPGAATEVSSCPHVLTPVVLLAVRKFQHDLMRRFPLQPLHQPADRHLRRYRNQQMHMVFDTCPFIIFTSCPRRFPGSGPHSRRSLSYYHRLPVLGRPYQVQVNLVYHVRAASVFSHPSSLLAALLAEAVA
jgi:hypothetical protein